MKILVIGGGGREHSIIDKLLTDGADEIYCAPGNGGIASVAKCVEIGATELDRIADLSVKEKFGLVFVAPDDPLSMGLVDMLESRGVRAFGPSKAAAKIEASKAYSKALMKKYGIPSAEYETFTDYSSALKYVRSAKYPLVVKADGLALGKGVVICQNETEAKDALKEMMVDRVFGASGNTVVIEQFLTGAEVSILTFCDGKTILPMISAQDHKKALDGDMGLNTGGMGTFAPSPKFTNELQKEFEEKIMLPTLSALNAEGVVYKGVLYFGLMMCADGLKVLEYNARFGDPETQVVLPLMKTSLLEVIDAVIDGRLSDIKLEWEEGSAVCVVMASGGYPKSYKKGLPIFGVADVDQDIKVYHAGTRLENGLLLTSGGRVLNVVAKGKNIAAAREKAYANIKKIKFEGAYYRTDIGIK